MSSGALMAVLLATAVGAEPLPDHVDIPDRFSTVICPDALSAQAMLERYHAVEPAPDNYTINTALFFQGLTATGCKQDGVKRKGTITIKAVQQRKVLAMGDGETRFVRYSGTDAAGVTVFGIVDEDGNNGFPRTAMAEWLSERANGGWLDARLDRGADWIFYRCDTPAKASTAVVATQGLEKAKQKDFAKKLAMAAEQQGCRRASDKYQVTALLSTSGNACGAECYVELTALAATDRSGLPVGLIYDASLM